MARREIFVSDLSGSEIPDGESALITITFPDNRKGRVVLDVATAEIQDLLSKGRKQAARGRPKKAQE